MATNRQHIADAVDASRGYHYTNGRQASPVGNYVNRHLYDLIPDHWEGCSCEREGWFETDNHGWHVFWPSHKVVEKRDHPERGPEYASSCPLDPSPPPKTIEQEQEQRRLENEEEERYFRSGRLPGFDAARVDALAPDHYYAGHGYTRSGESFTISRGTITFSD